MATKKKPAAKRPAASAAAAAKRPATASAQTWAQPSAKLYQLPFAQGDMGEAAQCASETIRSTAEQVMKAGSDAMQQFFGQNGAQFPQFQQFQQFQQFPQFQQFQFPQFPGIDAKAGEKAFAFGRDASEQLTKSAGSATRVVNEAVDISRENAEAIVEVGNIAVNVSKQVSAEIIGFVNKSFAQNVELSKQAFNCRTLNDMFDLQSKIVKSNLDSFFNESLKISELAFQCASDISEPLNERISESAERLTKVAAA
jgi:hypothetical protein